MLKFSRITTSELTSRAHPYARFRESHPYLRELFRTQETRDLPIWLGFSLVVRMVREDLPFSHRRVPRNEFPRSCGQFEDDLRDRVQSGSALSISE